MGSHEKVRAESQKGFEQEDFYRVRDEVVPQEVRQVSRVAQLSLREPFEYPFSCAQILVFSGQKHPLATIAYLVHGMLREKPDGITLTPLSTASPTESPEPINLGGWKKRKVIFEPSQDTEGAKQVQETLNQFLGEVGREIVAAVRFPAENHREGILNHRVLVPPTGAIAERRVINSLLAELRSLTRSSQNHSFPSASDLVKILFKKNCLLKMKRGLKNILIVYRKTDDPRGVPLTKA